MILCRLSPKNRKKYGKRGFIVADKNNANIGFEKEIWDAACVLCAPRKISPCEAGKLLRETGVPCATAVSAAVPKRPSRCSGTR